MLDETYSRLKDAGLDHREAARQAQAEVMRAGHTCIESMFGPYCTVCGQDIEWQKYWAKCPHCHGTGIVRSAVPYDR